MNRTLINILETGYILVKGEALVHQDGNARRLYPMGHGTGNVSVEVSNAHVTITEKPEEPDYYLVTFKWEERQYLIVRVHLTELKDLYEQLILGKELAYNAFTMHTDTTEETIQ